MLLDAIVQIDNKTLFNSQKDIAESIKKYGLKVTRNGEEIIFIR